MLTYFLVPKFSDGVWTIVFCPAFFQSLKLRYLEERTNERRSSAAGIASLITYEHAIVHEFMHVNIFKYKKHSKYSIFPD
jgi:hypothetical protein